MIVGVLLSLATAVLLVAVVHWIYTRKQQQLFFERLGIPYVKPHLIFGSNHILRDRSTTPMDFISKWRKQYGKVFGFFSGSRPSLVVSDLDMIKQILIKDFQNFSNRPKMTIKAEPVVSTVVGLRDQRWKDVRALLAPTFSMSKMKLMAGIMNEKVDELLRIVAEHEEKGEAVEWYTTYQGLTLDVICECALAIKSNCQRDKNDSLMHAVRGFLQNALNTFNTLAIYFPVVGQIMSFVSNQLAYSGRMTNMIVAHLKQVIKLRRKDSHTRTVDVLQLMLEASETIIEERMGKEGVIATPKKKMLTDDEIIANAWVFLLGGFETTANALTFSSYLLAKHKEHQDILYKEIRKTVEDPSAPLTYEQVFEMTYLDQVLSESLRLFPPVVTFIIREAAQDTEVCGVKIPKDTGILIPVWDIHRDPEQWPDPEKFDPERFSLASKRESTRHSMAYLPFGAGPRNCIGIRFGQLEAKLALARVILNYELELSPQTEDPPPLTVPTVAINPSAGIYCTAKKRVH